MRAQVIGVNGGHSNPQSNWWAFMKHMSVNGLRMWQALTHRSMKGFYGPGGSGRAGVWFWGGRLRAGVCRPGHGGARMAHAVVSDRCICISPVSQCEPSLCTHCMSSACVPQLQRATLMSDRRLV